MEAVRRNPEFFSLAVLSCLLTLLPILAPAWGLFLAIFAPFPLIVLGLKYPWPSVLGVLGTELGVGLLLGGPSVLLLANHYVVVPLVMAGALRRGYSMSQTVGLSVGVPLILSVILLALYSMVAQQSPRVLLIQYVEEMLQIFKEQVQTSGYAAGVSQDQLAILGQTLSQFLLILLPVMTVINHLLTNVVNYILVRHYCRYGRSPLALDPAALTLWRASDYLVWIFLASGVGLLLPVGAIHQLSLSVFLLTLVVYFLQGVAIAAFWGQRLPLTPRVRWFLALLILLFVGLPFMVLCTAAGLFDLWVDFRRQRRPPSVS